MTWTDEEIKRLETKINEAYTKAYRECKADLKKVLSDLESLPEDAPLSKKAALINKHDRLNKLAEQMARRIKEAGELSQDFISGSGVNTLKTIYNQTADTLGFSFIDDTVAKNILTEIENPFVKMAYLGLTDKQVINRRLTSELLTGLLKGDSIPKIAQRVKTVTEGYIYSAVRIARTETVRVANSARYQVGEQGKKLGLKLEKQWAATKDKRTRDPHRDADGQTVMQDEPFIVDGEELMFPCDVSRGASAHNVINCRCSMVYRIIN